MFLFVVSILHNKHVLRRFLKYNKLTVPLLLFTIPTYYWFKPCIIEKHQPSGTCNL